MNNELTRNRFFVNLFAIGTLQSVVRWLELLALGVFVYDHTLSAFWVTMVTLVKIAPLAMFGPLAGALAGRYSHTLIYRWGTVLMILVMLTGVLLVTSGQMSIGLALLISFAGGMFWVLDFPVRRSMIDDAVPKQMLGKAMTIDTLANNGTRALGPALGGISLQYVGLQGVFVLGMLIYLICLWLTFFLPDDHSVVGAGKSNGIVDNMREGFNVVQHDPLLKSVLLITVIYNLFAFPMLSLVPVLGRNDLELSASLIGLMASMEGAGAVLGGLLLIVFAQLRFYRKIYVFGLILGFFCSLFYAITDSPLVMGFALLIVGIGSACFAAMQSTLLILNSLAQHRSQILGFLSVSIGTGLIGFSLTGILAMTFGARAAIVISACCGLLSVLAICLRWPQIISVQSSPETSL